jgi:CRISPR-associated endonuclease/helicase Cas3
MFLAHSADLKKQISSQSYAEHIDGVVFLAGEAAELAARYAASNGMLLKEIVKIAAEYHDLGKLDDDNQRVLAGIIKSNSLPIQHTDAGTAYLLKQNSVLPAVLTRSHHMAYRLARRRKSWRFVFPR